MTRASDFEWRVYGKPKRRFWPLVLGLAALTAVHLLVPWDRNGTGPDFKAGETQEPARNETSAIANAAPPLEPTFAVNEPSSIARAAPSAEIINEPPKVEAPARSFAPRTEAAPNYATLRRELLGHLH